MLHTAGKCMWRFTWALSSFPNRSRGVSGTGNGTVRSQQEGQTENGALVFPTPTHTSSNKSGISVFSQSPAFAPSHESLLCCMFYGVWKSAHREPGDVSQRSLRALQISLNAYSSLCPQPLPNTEPFGISIVSLSQHGMVLECIIYVLFRLASFT